jgi:8-oxo-dGTP pyrophosphatase MutT (NUDIX family)
MTRANTMRVFEVDRLDCRFVVHRWSFAEERAAEIDDFWAARTAENPKLYDGPVLLACRTQEQAAPDGARVLAMELFETRFSRFLAWRDFGWADSSVYNCFSMAAVRSSDHAFLLGEMAPGHSSAGQIYFPGGTPDPNDIVSDGGVDLAGSLARELTEETGLRVEEGRAQKNWTIIFENQRIACVKRVDFRVTAATLQEKVRAFIAAETAPELSRAHFVSRADQLADARLPGFMVGYLAHAFAAQGRS